ncbi:MAG: OprO/OprP family phosphate-selective porin [Prevotellaceae bacterium]|jgi:phosphate-selective porin|nr:OprO/OprP family phosphate-selective porin [Prevotellaceae bacterium]
MNKKFIIALLGYFGLLAANAQEVELTPVEQLEQKTGFLESAVTKLQKFKVSGYIQAQYQYAEIEDDFNRKVGEKPNVWEIENADGISRFGVRRGRIKFTYDEKWAQGVFQLDITEKGVLFKDVYLCARDPWFETNSIKLGIFDRPFGNEISYSSSRRESPERSRIFQKLFPDERDLGAMLTFQGAKDTPWNMFKLEGGLFAGNGVGRLQFDSHMDFIGHLSFAKTIGSEMQVGAGASAYLGGVRMTNDSILGVEDGRFVLESKDNRGKIAKRQYIGFDAQFSAMWAAGLTQLRAEYIFGKHAGNQKGAFDYKFTALPPDVPTCMRNINGGYVIFTQDLGSLPFTLVAKYDWYNQNTGLSGNEITGKNDLIYSTFGLGAFWRIDPSLRLTAYYDIVTNEKSENVNEGKDFKDNVFTLRLQYKF